MKEKVGFLGLDVHAETIAVAEPEGEVRSLGVIPNRTEPVRESIRKLGPAERLLACTKPALPGMCCIGS